MKFTINLPPRTKKNHQQIITTKSGKRMVIPSKAFKEYQNAALWMTPRLPEAIDNPVNVKAVYYMDTHRRVDLPNLHNALLDVLVAAGVLADDNSNIVVSMDGSRVKYDKEHPRTEVEIDDRTGIECDILP